MITLLDAAIACFVVAIVHEFGHFIAAYALGLAVSSVEVGVGPRIVQVRWRGMWFRLFLFPTSGIVKLCWPSRRRWKNVTVFLAGPIANFMLAIILWLFLGSLSTVALMSLLIGVLNLIPVRDSDGMQIARQFSWAVRHLARCRSS